MTEKTVTIVEYRVNIDAPYRWSFMFVAEDEQAAKDSLEEWQAAPRKWWSRDGCQYSRERWTDSLLQTIRLRETRMTMRERGAV